MAIEENKDDPKAKKDGKKPDPKKAERKKDMLNLLKNNFNTHLLKVMIEVMYWSKLTSVITIPHSLSKLQTDTERLRVLRENVMLTVRDYNNIVVLIDDRERRLFDEHLAALNKTYDLGFKKYNWNNSQDAFIINCRKECSF